MKYQEGYVIQIFIPHVSIVDLMEFLGKLHDIEGEAEVILIRQLAKSQEPEYPYPVGVGRI